MSISTRWKSSAFAVPPGRRRDELQAAGQPRIGEHRQAGQHVLGEDRRRAVVDAADDADPWPGSSAG